MESFFVQCKFTTPINILLLSAYLKWQTSRLPESLFKQNKFYVSIWSTEDLWNSKSKVDQKLSKFPVPTTKKKQVIEAQTKSME